MVATCFLRAASGCAGVWGAPVLLLFGAVYPGPLPGVSLLYRFYRICLVYRFIVIGTYRHRISEIVSARGYYRIVIERQ